MNCFHCGSNDLRLSNLGSRDLPDLIMLRVPVRCRFCRDRFLTGLFRAWREGILNKPAPRLQYKRRSANSGSAITDPSAVRPFSRV